MTDEATEVYKIAHRKPESLNEHTVSKHWVLMGMTPEEFSGLHAGTQFDFNALLLEIQTIMPDVSTPVVPGGYKYSIEFASLVLFNIGPASREVKQGQRERTWVMTIPTEDGNSVNTIFVSTYKSKAPAIMQPTLQDKKICLTIKQASLIALHAVSQLVPVICNNEKILLTPLAGAIFCKSDLSKITAETGRQLPDLINMINESAQSGGFYLRNSTCAAAAVCAVVATKYAEKKVAVAIVTKTIKQYYAHRREMDWALFDILCKYATGGVPSGMSREELLTRLNENQKIHVAKLLKESSKTNLTTQPANETFGGGQGGSGGASGSSKDAKSQDILEVQTKN